MPIKPNPDTFGRGKYIFNKNAVVQAPDGNGLDKYHRLVGSRLCLQDELEHGGVNSQRLTEIYAELDDISVTEGQLRELVPDLDQRELAYQAQMDGVKAAFRK